MRVGEITGLHYCNIDLDEEIISVNHTLVYFDKGGTERCGFSINTPKTKAGERIIPMLLKVKEAFLMEKEYQKECGLACNAVVGGYTDFNLSIVLVVFSIKERLIKHLEGLFVIVIMRCLIKARKMQ